MPSSCRMKARLGRVKHAGQVCFSALRWWLMAPSLPAKRFLIFGAGRCGSTLLVSLLSSHSHIHCDVEILRLRCRWPKAWIYGRAARFCGKAYGFKLVNYQLRELQPIEDRIGFLRSLKEDGWRVIYLRRENRLRSAISTTKAHMTGRFHCRGEVSSLNRDKVTLAVDELMRYIERHEMAHAFEEELMRAVPGDLYLTYEKDLLNSELQQKTVNRICQLLGVPVEQVETDMIKLSSKNLLDDIANYEEVVSAIQNSRYAAFLDDGFEG